MKFYNYLNEERTPIKILTKMKMPLTEGDSRNCYENARIEFFAHKKKNKSPIYWVGWLSGVGIFPKKHKYENNKELFNNLHHAFVEVNGIIYDSTPFKYGVGDFNNLPEMLPINFLKNPIYKCLYSVSEENLKNKLKFFPKEEK